MPSKADKIKLTRAQDRRAKVTDEQVAEMRKLYAERSTQRALAERFKISQSAVSYIVSKKAHDHLREYRLINPPKRRSTQEAREYMRDLRKYKTNLYKRKKECDGK